MIYLGLSTDPLKNPDWLRFKKKYACGGASLNAGIIIDPHYFSNYFSAIGFNSGTTPSTGAPPTPNSGSWSAFVEAVLSLADAALLGFTNW